MPRRHGANIRSRRRPCPADTAQTSGREGADARPKTQNAPPAETAVTPGRQGEKLPPARHEHPRGHASPLDETRVTSRRDIRALSTRHPSPLDETSEPSRHDIPALSTRHPSPLDKTSEPSRH